MKAKIAGTALVITLALFILAGAEPANADEPDIPSGTMGLRIVQNSTGGDELQFFGLHSDSIDDRNNPSGDSRSDASPESLIDAIQRSMGLDPYISKVVSNDSVDDDFPTEVDVDTQQNIFAENNGTFTLNLDTGPMEQTVDDYLGTYQMAIAVCPLKIHGVDNFSRHEDTYQGNKNCYWWLEKSPSGDHLSFTEKPSSAPFWHTIGNYLAAIVIASLILLFLAFLIRRKWSRLGAVNMTLATVLALCGWLASTAAFFAIVLTMHSLDEFTLAHDVTSGVELCVGVGSALLFMIPFLLPAVYLVAVPPLESKVASLSAGLGSISGPGIPSWLSERPISDSNRTPSPPYPTQWSDQSQQWPHRPLQPTGPEVHMPQAADAPSEPRPPAPESSSETWHPPA